MAKSPSEPFPLNIDVDRPLTSEERKVVRWLLEHGNGDNSIYLSQLDLARVGRLCGCGCASIDFLINGEQPTNISMGILSDYKWSTADGHLCGAYVFEWDGLLAGLDLWSIDGQCTPSAMPPIERLVPFEIPNKPIKWKDKLLGGLFAKFFKR